MDNILIVDDRPENLEVMQDILQDCGYFVRTATDADGAFRAIEAREPDLLLLDLWLRDSSQGGMDILTAVRKDLPFTPVIMISAHGNIESAVQAIQKGAFTFVEKPINTSALTEVVKNALEVSRLRRENAAYRERDRRSVHLVGNSIALTKLRNTLESVAKGNSRVLFQGPLGSGKEEAARFLHVCSPRAAGPFAQVSGGVLSVGDAFLSAGDYRILQSLSDILEKADGGTLFIDEAADLTREVQVALLRVLVDQTRSRSFGGQRADVRVLAATAHDLRAMIREGKFRDDLFHRLAVIEVELPALSERRGDIPLLAQHFMEVLGAELGRLPRKISPGAMNALQSHNWPGNLRELKNIIERLMIVDDAMQAAPVGFRELPSEICGVKEQVPEIAGDEFVDLSIREARSLFERQYLLAQVARTNGNVARMAEVVGMERSALHRKLKSLGILSELRGSYKMGDAERRLQRPGYAGSAKGNVP